MSAMGGPTDDALPARIAALERLAHLGLPSGVAVALLIVPVGSHDAASPDAASGPDVQDRSLIGLIFAYDPEGRAQTLVHGALIVTAVCLLAAALLAISSMISRTERRGLLLTVTGLGVPASLLAWYLAAVFLPTRDEALEVFGFFGLVPAVLAWLFVSAESRAAFRPGSAGPE